MKITSVIKIASGVTLVLASIWGEAQVFQGLPAPYNAAPTVIEDQQQYAPPQRLSPRNQLFLRQVTPQQRYDAVTINRYLMGYPKTDYRVKPLVQQPMYQRPGD